MSDAQHRDAPTPTPEGPQPAGGVIAQAPTALIVCIAAVVITVLAGLIILILAGKSTTEFVDALKLAFGAVSSAGALLGTLYAASAAKSAKATREQTNGSLDARIEQHVAAGVQAALGVRPARAPRSGPLGDAAPRPPRAG